MQQIKQRRRRRKRKNVRRQQQRKKLVLQNQNAHVINVVLFPTRISFILCQKCKIRKIIHSCFFPLCSYCQIGRDEVTLNNIHENHLCCKPISSIQGLSSSDQKKLIEHDCLTLISLLPIYLGAQGNFVGEIREKTNISHEGALELDRLMNEWSSTRLFIGANSHYKTLTQKI